MRRPIALLVRNPVAAKLTLVFVVASGIIAATVVKVELYPEAASDRIGIEVPYLGAAPEEVEAAVVLRIEEAVRGIDGVKEIRSVASEGRASVTVELEMTADPQWVLDEVEHRVGAITTFPVETERPVVRRMTARDHVTDVAVSGPVDTATLKAAAERVRDDLLALPGITHVEIVGAPADEIAIEVSEAMLRRHGLTFDRVADAVRRSSVDVPGGSIRSDRGDILLRTVGQAHWREEYENLLLWARPDGSRLRVGDVAAVVDGFVEQDLYARFDGEPAVTLAVLRTGDQSTLDVAEAVHAYVDRARSSFPENLSITVWRDQAAVLEGVRSTMLRNGASALALVFIVLALFLDGRIAAWVSLGIAFCFLGTVALMPAFDVSINIISLFTFILVLGIVVDDAIMVGENVCRHQETSGLGARASIEGALEVAPPIAIAALTTCAAFTPLLFVPGTLGDLCRVIPVVAIPCLLLSLLEAFGILPAHLSRTTPWSSPPLRYPRPLSRGLRWIVRECYQPALAAALRWRYLTAALALAALVLTGGMVLGGRIGFHFLPSIEDDYVAAVVRMPPGAPVEATAAAVAAVEASAVRLRARLLGETGTDYIRHVWAVVGDQPMAAYSNGPLFPGGAVAASSVGEVGVQLAPAETRSLTSEQIGAMWRAETGRIPEALEVSFILAALSPGADVEVQLAGPDPDRLQAVAATVKRQLAAYEGVHSISDSFRSGKEQLRLGITPSAEGLGLRLQDLGRQVRQAFYGEEAQRIQRGRDDVRVMVRYPGLARRSLGDLENMRIRTPEGGEVPFSQVARAERGRGFASIRRIDGDRTLSVSASVDSAITSTSAIAADLRARILPAALAGQPDVSYTFGGVEAAQRETIDSLRGGFSLTLLAMYLLLAVLLRSYVQPVIIMSAIPFGVLGSVWGHLAVGLDVTIISVLGMVALTGIVVNDSLVMVDFINHARRTHHTLGEEVRAAGARLPDYRRFVSTGLYLAISEAGSNRFRPIVLTTVTTALGMTPLMLERSMHTSFLVPMAVSLAFGVICATLVTLILVPVVYMLLDDLMGLLHRIAVAMSSARQAAPGSPG